MDEIGEVIEKRESKALVKINRYSARLMSSNNKEQGIRDTVIRVEGMKCFFCFKVVAGILKDFKGIKEIRVGLDRGEARVIHHADRVSSSHLVETLEGAGYTVKIVETPPELLSEFEATDLDIF